MRLIAHHYTAKRNLRVLLTILIFLLLVVGLAWGASKIFVLRQIEVTGDAVDIEVDKNRLGKNILFMQTEPLEKQVLSAYPLLASVRITKSFPSTLVLHVALRTPYVFLTSGALSYVLDKDGVVLGSKSGTMSLPTLIIDVGAVSIGSHVSHTAVVGSLEFLQTLHDIPIEEMRLKGSANLQARSGHTNIFLPQSGDIKGKAATLQTIVAGFRIKGALPAVIDLRFDKPIITY